MKLLILFTAIILTSCATTKRYSYEAVNLQEGGEIAKNRVQCTVIKSQRTMKGFKTTLVTAKSDTIYRYYQKPLELNHCYYIWKTREEKNL